MCKTVFVWEGGNSTKYQHCNDWRFGGDIVGLIKLTSVNIRIAVGQRLAVYLARVWRKEIF